MNGPATNGPAWPAADLPTRFPHPAESLAGPVPRGLAAAEAFGAQPTEPLQLIRVSTPVETSAAPAGQPPARRRKARSGRKGLAIAGVALGIAGLAASLAGVIGQARPRQLTAAEQQKIMAWEVASRWRTWPAGRIFPDSVGYPLTWTLFENKSPLIMSAHRTGIARQSTCAAGLDRGLARVLDRRGCETVLRATYADSTGGFVATVGVVIMHGTAPASGSLPGGHRLAPGVRAVPFRGTLAARFGNRQRQMTGASARGPYLILYTAGYADGRQRDRVSSNPYASSEMKDLAAGLARDIGRPLGALPPVPRCPRAPGC
ncbi:MAG: hypothetical protein LBV78_18355 [Kitasatospora sp.]|jgi:hypothetical protein|nr:hypothetical protein [Kitasatospora sp.]